MHFTSRHTNSTNNKGLLYSFSTSTPYLDLPVGTSIVQTAEISYIAMYVAGSLFTTMKIGLDESTKREPKAAVM